MAQALAYDEGAQQRIVGGAARGNSGRTRTDRLATHGTGPKAKCGGKAYGKWSASEPWARIVGRMFEEPLLSTF